QRSSKAVFCSGWAREQPVRAVNAAASSRHSSLFLMLVLQSAVEAEDIPHVAAQVVADTVDGVEADAVGLAGAENGEVGLGDAHLGAQLLGGDAPLLQDFAEMYRNGHSPPPI